MDNAINLNEMEPIAKPLLPIIFVIDTSTSMDNGPMSIVNHTMEDICKVLREFAEKTPDALLKIGVLQFSSGAEWMQPKGLEELDDFVYEHLKAGGMTYLGAALTELDEKLSRNVFLASKTGWSRPILIFMSDGYPNDDWKGALAKIHENKWFNEAIKIAFGIGENAANNILAEVVGDIEAVVKTDDLELFAKMLKNMAVKSAMVGSKSHGSSEMPTGKDIVKMALEEEGVAKDVQTAQDLDVEDKEQDKLEDNTPKQDGNWDVAGWK